MIKFDFGPVSRTVDASTGSGEAINFASLPLHEIMTALLASNDRNEFVAWLWHDLFKPLFWWQWNSKKKKLDWIHYPKNDPSSPLNVEARWAAYTGIPAGLVESHHYKGRRKLKFQERETINNEFDQMAIGKNARFVQLSFLAEPAAHTALLRAVIADAFMEVITKMVAASIQTELGTGSPTFERVRYVFDFKCVALSNPPTDSEIESLAKQYTLRFSGNELIIDHLTPVRRPDLDNYHAEVVVDLSAEPPTKDRFVQGIISLVEVLTVYQDGRTILMGIPQFTRVDIAIIEQQLKTAVEQRLHDIDIRWLASSKELKKQSKIQGRVDWVTLPLKRKGQDIALLAHVLEEQIDIRIIEGGKLTETVKTAKGKTYQVRFLTEIVSHPIAILAQKPRRCRFCNSAFDSAFPAGRAVVGNYFTDVEHVGLGGDICPMCRIYMLNSHKSRTKAEKARGVKGDRKGYRGAFTIVSPSSHFTYDEFQCKLIEHPPLDIGGRFSAPLQRATVTLQEYALFNMLSRRIISNLWEQLDGRNASRALPLPYFGALLLTQNEGSAVRALFDCLVMLFDKVKLRAYPFEVIVRPSVELAFEMAVNDLKQHHTKHTYLKTNPTIVSIDPNSKFALLIDNGVQLEVSRQFFEDRERVNELLTGINGLASRRNWLLAALQGMDPVTAAMEAFYDLDAPLHQVEKMFWDAHFDASSLAEQWQQYEKVRKEVGRIISKYPMLIEFFSKPRR